MSQPKRLFTQEQLQEFAKDFMQLALEAIERGDRDTAMHWCRRNQETEWYVHDSYLLWIPEILTIVYDTFGEDSAAGAIKAAIRDASAIYDEHRLALIGEKGLRGHVEYIVDYFWRHRFGSYRISEDEEKITFDHSPCGSGGRLMDRKTFYAKTVYDSPVGYSTLKKAGHHTWGERGVPIYCAQCSWLHEIFPVETYGPGAQWWIHATPFPRRPGDHCVHHIYKDADAIPESAYQRIGVEKRASRREAVEGRLFGESELREMEQGYMPLALAALTRGDLEAAARWCRRFDETKFPVHDAGAVTVSKILSYIAEKHGEQAAISVLKHSPAFFCEELFYKPKQKMVAEQGIGAWVEFMVDYWRQHVSPIEVTEDDEKVIINVKTCGSGGRLLNLGYYDTPGGHHRIQNCGHHTWGRERQPIYCGHCTWIHETLPVFHHGKGAQLWVHPWPYSPEKHQPCVHYIYKDPTKIPADYYERVGLADWPVQASEVPPA
ncbi:MAG: hypothetical protein IT495_12765 [Gammaproteobacteria bacterium]|nr:hypothetical protein [Gammaproteobacteria bacterium]